jgi:hypothetical protein
MNVEERGNPPHKTPSKSIDPRRNKGFAKIKRARVKDLGLGVFVNYGQGVA